MQLREWQHNFQRVVLGTENVDAIFLQAASLPRELSMGIYANAYRERLHEALRSNYPALHQVLGDADFAEMAYAFIAAHPPQTASIRWFGDALSNYLRTTNPFCDLPILSELAQFEWALRHTVDAGDGECIDANYLQSLRAEEWETLRCAVHPSLSILNFEWNAPQVWRALDENEEPPLPAQLENIWFVYRDRDMVSQWRSASSDEAAAIELWRTGNNFGDICEFLAQQMGDTDAAIATLVEFMRAWVEQGLLTDASAHLKSAPLNTGEK